MEIGRDPAEPGFAFDNEGPQHRVFLQPFELVDRPVSNAEWQAFIADGGYRRPELWLSDGWAAAQAQRWSAPLYWEETARTPPRVIRAPASQYSGALQPCACTAAQPSDSHSSGRR